MKVVVHKMLFFHMDGVTSGWVAQCPAWGCNDHWINQTYNDFHEGALLTAIEHVKWHQEVLNAQI